MMMRAAFAVLFLLTGTALAAPASEPVAGEPGHSVSPTADSKGAVNRRQFEQRFETSAVALAKGRPGGLRADRYAAFDIAWPRDAEEWKRMGGNTVIVLGALSQNTSELPLARAYLERPDGRTVILKRLGYTRRTLEPGSQAAQAFGPHVSEEFYLVPANELGQGVMLKCDFARNRQSFVLSSSLVPLRALPAQTAAGKPQVGAVQTMVMREYPGFGVVLSDGIK
jgi:hypothetical protein